MCYFIAAPPISLVIWNVAMLASCAKRVARDGATPTETKFLILSRMGWLERQATIRGPASQPTKHSFEVTLPCELPTGSSHPRVATYVPSTGYARAQATTGAGNEEEK